MSKMSPATAHLTPWPSKIKPVVFFNFVAEINAATAGKLGAVLRMLTTPSPTSAPKLPVPAQTQGAVEESDWVVVGSD